MKHFIRIPALFLMLLIAVARQTQAHPMPNSILLMDIRHEGISAELQLPLKELQLAVDKDVTGDPQTLVARFGPWLQAYVSAHFRPRGMDGRDWRVRIDRMAVTKAEQEATGPFEQLDIQLWLQPPPGGDVRRLRLYYDVIMHQVVTHTAIVAVRQDWAGGLVREGGQTELGYFHVSTRDNTLAPMDISLDKGSSWKGFKSMVALGMDHIREGTDHLLFLLALLLPAPLIARDNRWIAPGGAKYSIARLLKIITAFTLGHSSTLLAGALGWLRLPQQPVELLIAVSVLITAAHAIRPLFPGREMWVAAGFGLVHGLAFATTLAALHLEGGRMALSILGFNIGIELMQLFVILLIVPWLVILSMSPAYRWVRIGGATLAGIAALAWIAERISMKPNRLAAAVQPAAAQGKWIAAGLACCALMSYVMRKRSPDNDFAKAGGQHFVRN